MRCKRFVFMAVTATVVLFVLAGCSSLINMLSRTVDIEIGRQHSTQWFNFTIHSADVVGEYAGHIAAPGHQLWRVDITQTGTFHQSVPMFIFDWYMDDDTFRAQLWPLPQFEDHEDMMPDEFWLPRGQSERHIMLFEVPTATTNLTLNFVEIDEADATGSRFALRLQ